MRNTSKPERVRRTKFRGLADTGAAETGNPAPAVAPARLRLIGAATGIGAPDDRCRHGPAAVLNDDFVAGMSARGVTVGLEMLEHEATPVVGPRRMLSAAGIYGRVADQVHMALYTGHTFAVVGGDHSIAIGTWSGAYRARIDAGPIGLVWVDAHMDSHLPDTSPSGNLHGMPLAVLLGRGPRMLTGIASPGPALLPQNVCLLGPRSYEPEEYALLKRLGVRIIDAEDVRSLGINEAMREAVSIAAAAPGGFGVTIDLDAIDPEEAPGVGSPVPGGLGAGGLIDALSCWSAVHPPLGVEVVEYNPARDRDGATAGIARSLIGAALNHSKSSEKE